MALLCSLLICATMPVRSQEFEVASIKPTASPTAQEFDGSNRGQFTATNISLHSLIARAYGMADYQIVGPDSLSGSFDVAAKFPKDFVPSSSAIQAMLRKMLADRFKLEAHTESKMMPVYAVTVEKKGVKFGEVAAGCSGSINNQPGDFTGTCISMKSFAMFVSWHSDLPVIDMTEMTGVYDIRLKYIAQRPQSAFAVPTDPAAGLTLETAMQEHLGLKLEHRKAPIEVLVIDRVEKLPTEN